MVEVYITLQEKFHQLPEGTNDFTMRDHKFLSNILPISSQICKFELFGSTKGHYIEWGHTTTTT